MTDDINKIISETDIHWSKDEIIRYLYVKLAPYFKRDLDYFLADKSTQIRMYQNGFKSNTNIVVCKTLSEFYNNIYREFNIKSKIITTNKKDVPHYTLIVNGDFGWYCIDPLKDLFSNQMGLRTNFFGIIPDKKYSIVKETYPFLISLTKEYIEYLDKKLHLVENGLYLDEFFQMIHLEMINNGIASYFHVDKKDTLGLMSKKLKFAEKYLINLGNVPGLYERNILYTYIIDCIFDQNEKNFITTDILKNASNYKIILNLRSRFNNQFVFEEVLNSDNKHYLKRIR